jgi:hypothetical protein
MKQNKVAIVVLVIIALLFVLGLSSGVFRSKGDNDGNLTMSKAEKRDAGWMAWLNDAMKPFRPSLDSRRLAPQAACRTGDRSYRLTDEKTCIIQIAASIDGEAVENADITVEDPKVSVKLRYYSDEKDSESTRGMPAALGRVKTAKKMLDIGKFKPPRIPTDSIQHPLELTVIYLPQGEEKKPNKTMAVEGEVRLTVLEKGGELQLQCKGCNRQNKRAIEVKLK